MTHSVQNRRPSSTRLGGSSDFGGFKPWKFFKRGVKSAGRSAKRVRRKVHKGLKSVGKGLGSVPLVGKGLKGLYDLSVSPIRLTADLSTGVRPDKAIMRDIKANVRAVKGVAPYARMVVSLVPGVGTGIGAALSAGLALAEGQPITAAIQEAVKGAIPGGTLVKQAFDVSLAAAQGKRIDKIALAALPLNGTQKRALGSALNVVADAAAGKRVDKSILKNAMKSIPKEYTKAIDIGAALGTGINVQKLAKKALKPEVLNSLQHMGTARIEKSKVLASPKGILNKSQRRGYAIGLGAMSRRLKPNQLTSIHANIPKKGLLGFNMAIAAHIGSVATAAKGGRFKTRARKQLTAREKATAYRKAMARAKAIGRRGKKPNKLQQPQWHQPGKTSAQKTAAIQRAKFGFLVTAGMAGASPKLKTALARKMVKDPDMRKGMQVGIKEVNRQKTWWSRMKVWFRAKLHIKAKVTTKKK